jgi:transcriptional regulator with XRE-family HTH domain
MTDTNTNAIVPRESAIQPDRTGRPATGLYPHVSRRVLADLTGRDISTITQILRGRSRSSREVEAVIARAVRIPLAQLQATLGEQREKYREAHAAHAAHTNGNRKEKGKR